MALIEVHHVSKLTATVQVEAPIAKDVDRYAAFIGASADDVINRALEYLFAKDKDFQKHLQTHGNATVTPSLQVRNFNRSSKAATPGKVPATVAGK